MWRNLRDGTVWMFGPRRARRVPAWASVDRLILGGALAIALVAGAMVWADAWAREHQRGLPEWLVRLFEDITGFGRSGWILIPIGVALLVLAAISTPALGRMGQGVLASFSVRLAYIFAAIAVPGSLVGIVKRLIGRARPYLPQSSGPFDYSPLGWQPDFASLPSGHGTSVFATAFALGALLPRLRLPLLLFAILIAVSRVIVAAHYPSDVIAGALVGWFGALAIRNVFAMRGLAFSVAPDRSVRPMAGPSRRRLAAVFKRVLAIR